LFILLTFVFILLFLFSPYRSPTFFFVTCFTLGFGIGYWALFVTIAAEQFGTNLRATVATSVPNFIRGTVVPLTLMFKFLRTTISDHFEGSTTISDPKHTGLIYGALIVGIFTIIVAVLSLKAIDETFGRDLDFEEENQT
jgi:hypothetical protein